MSTTSPTHMYVATMVEMFLGHLYGCGQANETILHLLWTCLATNYPWSRVVVPFSSILKVPRAFPFYQGALGTWPSFSISPIHDGLYGTSRLFVMSRVLHKLAYDPYWLLCFLSHNPHMRVMFHAIFFEWFLNDMQIFLVGFHLSLRFPTNNQIHC